MVDAFIRSRSAPASRRSGVDLLERLNLRKAAASIAKIVDKESDVGVVDEGVAALDRLDPDDMTDSELRRLVAAIDASARSSV